MVVGTILLWQWQWLSVCCCSAGFGLGLCNDISLVNGTLHNLLFVWAEVLGEVFVERRLLLL